jgi:hypothetical protein
MAPQRRCASRARPTTTSSSTCPRSTAPRQADVKGSAVPAAAVRVLGRLRRLRRDAVRQAADAAVRRPPADRQRHRLLVDLRRQPADDAVHVRTRRPRPGLVELAVRGQRRVRLRLPAGGRQARRAGARAAARSWRRQIGDDLVTELLKPTRDRGGHRGPARARRGAAAEAGSRSTAAEPRRAARAAGRLPGQEERLDRRRRRLGLRHRLRRPRPRAGQRARRQHPGARHRGLLEHRRPGSRRPRRSARRPSSPRRARPGQEGPGLMAMSYGNVYVARVAFGAKDAQTVRAFRRPKRIPGPSLIIAYSHCIAHGYDLATARPAEAGGGQRATGRCTASTRARWPIRPRHRAPARGRRRRRHRPAVALRGADHAGAAGVLAPHGGARGVVRRSALLLPEARRVRVRDRGVLLEQIARIKEAVGMPVIASLNGATPAGWLEYAGCCSRPAPTRSSSTSTTSPPTPPRRAPPSRRAWSTSSGR